MPLQHINDTMLRRMQRRVNRAETEELLGRAAQRIPDLVLRTTFITGFPGETDEQFEELVELVEQRRFRAAGGVHLFVRARHAGGPARRHLTEEVKEARREALMAVQQEVAFDWNERQIGRQLDVLLDTPVPDEPNAWIGRTYADAPDVDGVVYVTGKNCRPGKSCRARSWPPVIMIWSACRSGSRGRVADRRLARADGSPCLEPLTAHRP